MADWKATERVLDRVKYVATLGNGASIDEEQASKDEKAIEAVFKFVLLGADRNKHKKNWSFVGAHLKGRRKEQQALRARVRGRLEPRFESDAFVVTVTFENSEDVNAALNKFRREDLLAWGTELLAADATPAAASNPAPQLEKPEDDKAADAAANAEVAYAAAAIKSDSQMECHSAIASVAALSLSEPAK